MKQKKKSRRKSTRACNVGPRAKTMTAPRPKAPAKKRR